MRFNFKDTNATARNELWETYSDMFEKVFKVRPTVAYKQDAKYEDLVSFVAAIEKNDRLYNIEELKLKNPLQKNFSGVDVQMKIREISLGK